MSELILRQEVIDASSIGQTNGADGRVRVDVTATRVTISPWNLEADEVLNGSLVIPADKLREIMDATRP